MYILIAYKPDSDDYAMGNVSARYPSDFASVMTKDKEKLKEYWAEYLFRNWTLEVSEERYSFNVIKDGVSTGDHIIDILDNTEETEESVKIKNEIYTIKKEVLELAEKKYIQHLDQKVKDKLDKEAKEQKEEKEERRKKYEELKKEFES